jgi:catechol 2,3-dioxygenase-like lactoylglutathione lyase family enzyme
MRVLTQEHLEGGDMAGAGGIGGIFLDSEDPAALAAWYDEHLGVGFTAARGLGLDAPEEESFFRVFRTRDIDSREVRENPVFAINKATGPLAPGDERGHVIGLRVDDVEAVLAHLATMGVEPESKMLEWEGGKHIRIRDPDGNQVELYEELPLVPDSPYR